MHFLHHVDPGLRHALRSLALLMLVLAASATPASDRGPFPEFEGYIPVTFALGGELHVSPYLEFTTAPAEDGGGVGQVAFWLSGLPITIGLEDAGSDDPEFVVTIGPPEDGRVHAVPGDLAFVAEDGHFFVAGNMNDLFDRREVFEISRGGFTELHQPHHKVGLRCELNETVHLTYERCYGGDDVLRVPAGQYVDVLVDDGECPNGDLAYLVATPFGITGWTTTMPGDISKPGKPLTCIVWHGD